MSAVLIGEAEPGSPEWHDLRRAGIGASEIAAVVGLSPWVSAFQLWHRKKGNIPEQAQSSAMSWGHRLEPVVREWWQEQHPEFEVVATPGTYAHSERSWQRVNPDGLVHRSDGMALYEGKTASGFSAHEWGPSWSDKIPLGYRCQIMHSLDVFGFRYCYVAVLIGGNDPRQYVVEFDAEDAKTLRDAGAAFWESLQTGDEPPLDASFETYETVRQLHPQIARDEDADVSHLWPDYAAAKAAYLEAEARLTLEKSRLLQAMGDAHYATHQDIRVARRQVSSAGNPYFKEIAS